MTPRTAPAAGPGAPPRTGGSRLCLCGHARCRRGAGALGNALVRGAARVGSYLRLETTVTVCDGYCAGGPYLGLPELGMFYGGLAVADAPEILSETVAQGRLLFERLLLSPCTVTDSRLLYLPADRVMVLLEPGLCPVGAVRYLLDFRGRESCGKCLPCRQGVARLWTLLTALEEGGAGPGHLVELAAVAGVMHRASYCDFGPKAAAPVLFLLELAAPELERHLEGGCPRPGGPGFGAPREV